MSVRFCIEMKNKKKFFSIDLWNRINNSSVNMIDLGDRVFVTGVTSHRAFCDVLLACLMFGVVECEVGIEKNEHKALD